MEYSAKLSEVPVRFDIFRRNERLFDWYVKRYNPFVVQEADVLGIKSYKITLPFTYEEQNTKPDKINLIMDKTLNALIDLEVDYFLPPKKFSLALPEMINISDRNKLFPFFIMPAIKKSLRFIKKDIKDAEILIIDGGSVLTEMIIDNIYREINFLTVMTADTGLYEGIAEEIFNDNGLMVQITETNKAVSKDADIIINTAGAPLKLDYSFKSGAVYFDLSGNEENLNSLAVKRSDMRIINNLQIKTGDEIMSLSMLEPVFYCLSGDYRFMVNRRYSPETGRFVAEDIERFGVALKSLCFNDTLIR